MANPTITPQAGKDEDQEIWLSLRQAISKSSGFQSWQEEREVNIKMDLDTKVRCYLKETLETLAY